jgi:hypothetical protein
MDGRAVGLKALLLSVALMALAFAGWASAGLVVRSGLGGNAGGRMAVTPEGVMPTTDAPAST